MEYGVEFFCPTCGQDILNPPTEIGKASCEFCGGIYEVYEQDKYPHKFCIRDNPEEETTPEVDFGS